MPHTHVPKLLYAGGSRSDPPRAALPAHPTPRPRPPPPTSAHLINTTNAAPNHPSPPPIPPVCGDHAKSPTVNKANAQNAILFEAISLCLALDAGRDLLQAAVGSLARFLSVKVRGRCMYVGGWGWGGGCL